MTGFPQAFTKEILDVHFLVQLSLSNYKLPPDLDSNFQVFLTTHTFNYNHWHCYLFLVWSHDQSDVSDT